MEKSRVFKIATAWTLKRIMDVYLPKEPKLVGGYVGAKYGKVKITVIAEKI